MSNNTKTAAPMRGPGNGPGKHGYARPQNMGKTLRFLMGYIGKHKLLLVVVIVCLFASSFAMVAGNYFLRPLINNYILARRFCGLAKMLTVMALVYLTGACCSYAYAPLMVHISQADGV